MSPTLKSTFVPSGCSDDDDEEAAFFLAHAVAVVGSTMIRNLFVSPRTAPTKPLHASSCVETRKNFCHMLLNHAPFNQGWDKTRIQSVSCTRPKLTVRIHTWDNTPPSLPVLLQGSMAEQNHMSDSVPRAVQNLIDTPLEPNLSGRHEGTFFRLINGI